MPIIGRQYLESRTELVYRATRDCTIDVWCVNTIDATHAATRVFLSKDTANCTLALGVPLPMERPVTIGLLAGESLFGISEREGLVGFSVMEV